ncbi:MAG TPA: 2-dehydro-3-deoxy-D-gluconate 5-dehydrogenase KduD [Herpetosiphonaceae bacterium]|nr:2-dehydro-3-deoxy-D-gluconate 5-dehydrogenase KduD [Herpetosiphonaceae bacterium]
MKTILDRFRLDGQVALITGASRGLGLGMAAALAEAGADIVSIQRGSETLRLAERIEAAGGRLLSIALDIAMPNAAEYAVAAALAQFGRIDILVNNAGIQRRAPAAEFPLPEWDAVLAVNLDAVFRLCQAAGREMIRQGHGKIINIASLLAFQGGITIPAYAASKHAIIGLTKALCNEWARHNVNVNAIAPGYMDTDLNVALRADSERDRAIRERIPAGRWGEPDDLAGAVVFLASSASDYMHGHTLVVDGGWLAR